MRVEHVVVVIVLPALWGNTHVNFNLTLGGLDRDEQA